jgi:hypothetical protein
MKEMNLPIGLHLKLSVMAYISAGMGGFLLGIAIGAFIDLGAHSEFLGAVLGVGGYLVSWKLFRELIPARCLNCGKVTSYQRDLTPFVYVCSSCGDKYVTNFSWGNTDGYYWLWSLADAPPFIKIDLPPKTLDLSVHVITRGKLSVLVRS